MANFANEEKYLTITDEQKLFILKGIRKKISYIIKTNAEISEGRDKKMAEFMYYKFNSQTSEDLVKNLETDTQIRSAISCLRKDKESAQRYYIGFAGITEITDEHLNFIADVTKLHINYAAKNIAGINLDEENKAPSTSSQAPKESKKRVVKFSEEQQRNQKGRKY